MRLSRSIVGEKEAEAVRRVICDDGYLGMGETTRQFEEAVADYLGIEPWQAVSVNSGTAALHLACQCALAHNKTGFKPDCGHLPQILAPSLTFVAAFQAIRASGCMPVACDALPETGTLDLADAEKRITERTIALMHVDYASNPWHLEKAYALAEKYKLRMIDDAAHAFGCRHHGRKIGSFGDLVCFSFDGIKNITCGEGGMLVCFNREDAKLAQDARLLGVDGDTQKRFDGTRSWDPDVRIQGWRYHMSNIMAAIGLTQLGRLENEFIPARRELFRLYSELLEGTPHLKFLETDPQDFIAPHILPVRILDGLRDRAAEGLARAGIPTGMHYKPNHLLSLFANSGEKLPGAEELYAQLLTLPLHPGLSREDVGKVCAELRAILE